MKECKTCHKLIHDCVFNLHPPLCPAKQFVCSTCGLHSSSQDARRRHMRDKCRGILEPRWLRKHITTLINDLKLLRFQPDAGRFENKKRIIALKHQMIRHILEKEDFPLSHPDIERLLRTYPEQILLGPSSCEFHQSISALLPTDDCFTSSFKLNNFCLSLTLHQTNTVIPVETLPLPVQQVPVVSEFQAGNLQPSLTSQILQMMSSFEPQETSFYSNSTLNSLRTQLSQPSSLFPVVTSSLPAQGNTYSSSSALSSLGLGLQVPQFQFPSVLGQPTLSLSGQQAPVVTEYNQFSSQLQPSTSSLSAQEGIFSSNSLLNSFSLQLPQSSSLLPPVTSSISAQGNVFSTTSALKPPCRITLFPGRCLTDDINKKVPLLQQHVSTSIFFNFAGLEINDPWHAVRKARLPQATKIFATRQELEEYWEKMDEKKAPLETPPPYVFCEPCLMGFYEEKSYDDHVVAANGQ